MEWDNITPLGFVQDTTSNKGFTNPANIHKHCNVMCPHISNVPFSCKKIFGCRAMGPTSAATAP
jgi:hypothetical protein